MKEKDKNRIKQIINENIGLSVEEIYRKITVIQELLDNGAVSEAKSELEYLRQELHMKGRR